MTPTRTESHKMRQGNSVFCTFLLIATASTASAAPLFFDDFEGGLGLWVGDSGGTHNGVDVLDPVEGDTALNFAALNSAGDVFSVTVIPAGSYILEFDYLGLPSPEGTLGNLGGFIGISEGLPLDHRWLEGTFPDGGAEDDALIDDGIWRHYVVPFTSVFPFHVMIEDYVGSGGIPGDAYFDNVAINVVPEPSALTLLGLGSLALLARRSRA